MYHVQAGNFRDQKKMVLLVRWKRRNCEDGRATLA
jgi:hypothetical protein